MKSLAFKGVAKSLIRNDDFLSFAMFVAANIIMKVKLKIIMPGVRY